MNERDGPGFLRIIGMVAVLVASFILVFFALGFLIVRLFA